MKILLAISILLLATALGCAHDPCDYSVKEFQHALGRSEPKALDMDGNGLITAGDYGRWLEQCDKG